MASINQACNVMSPSKNGNELQKLFAGLLVDVASLTAQLNQLRADFAGHVHTGVTVGAGSTAAAVTTAVAVALTTTA